MQGVAIVLLIVAGFAIFITWARTQTGRGVLKQTLGEPHSFKRRARDARHWRAISSGNTGARSRPTSKPKSSPRQPAAAGKAAAAKSTGAKSTGGRPSNGK